MWLILLTIMVWVPLLVMSVTFVVIWIKIRHSFKTFPYLSHQSYNARSRKKVIRMLLFLIVMELICWAPWSFFVICDYIIDKYYRTDHLLQNPYPMVQTWFLKFGTKLALHPQIKDLLTSMILIET